MGIKGRYVVKKQQKSKRRKQRRKLLAKSAKQKTPAQTVAPKQE